MSKNWLKNTSKEVLNKIEELPDSFSGFKADLLAREDVASDVELIELVDLSWSDHFGFVKFKVKSEMAGGEYYAEYISRRGGKFHCLRGVVLVKQRDKVTHFIVRKCQRFGLEQEVFETIGNIQKTAFGFQNNKFELSAQIEEEVKNILHVNELKIERFFDLGSVYTDVSMFNNIVRIFALTVEVDDIREITVHTEDKVFNNSATYSYKIEVIPVEKFYEFFGKVSDSLLLAIFGRLQALDIIKLQK